MKTTTTRKESKMAKSREERGERTSTARRRAETHTGGFSRTTFRVPDGMSVWQPKAGETYTVDILPYKVGKRKFAAGITFADPGFDHYERTYFNHARIGPNEDAYACSARTFDKPCPICEYRGKIAKEGAPQDDIKALYAKERQIFCVYDHAEKAKGPQLWEFSYHLFGKLLDTRVKSAKGGRYDCFYFPDKEGRTLEITFVEKAIGTNKFAEVVSIDFTEREKAIPAEVLEKVPDLGELIIEMPYDKLKQIFLQEPGGGEDDEPNKRDEEDEDDEPKAKKKPAKDDDEDDDDDDEDDPKPASKKKPVKEDDDDDDDEPKAKAKPAKKVKDDDDDDDDDDDEPAKKKLPSAVDLGIEVGSVVIHDGDKCKVTRVSPDGTSLTLKDPDGEVRKGVGPNEVQVPKAKPVAKDDDEDDDDEPKPAKKPAKKAKDDDDDWEDEDD